MYIDIDGYRLNMAFSEDLYRSALAYRPRSDDTFVVTFQKCGTTWTQQIVYLILHDGVPPPTALEFFKSSPFLEMFGADAAKLMKRPGLIKTHLPYHLAPKNSQAKYINVCRNPKDACVSLFYHTRDFSVYQFTDGKFEVFFELFLNGQTDNGDYFDHVLSWYAHRNDPNVLMIHYEEMKADPEAHVLEIAKFLDEERYKSLTENQEMLRNVLKYSNIAFMKPNFEENMLKLFSGSVDGEDLPEGVKKAHDKIQQHPGAASFTRKGIVGDWKTHFSAEMNVRMEQKIMEKLGHTSLIDIWKKHGVM